MYAAYSHRRARAIRVGTARRHRTRQRLLVGEYCPPDPLEFRSNIGVSCGGFGFGCIMGRMGEALSLIGAHLGRLYDTVDTYTRVGRNRACGTT